MALVILIALILLNGVFALAELAIVSANKARLEQASEAGSLGARTALDLANDPNRFLSTVQIGITLVGIFAGAFGGTALADDFAQQLNAIFALPVSIAEQISFGLIILFTTYLSLVIGELVPKRIALNNPEKMAILIARPMKLLASVSAPLVWFLSKSSEIVARLLGVQGADTNFITDFEVIAMVREGLVSGEFNTDEHDMVKGVLELDDRRVREIATPRTDIVWFDIDSSQDDIRQILQETSYSAYIVADKTIDNILGVVSTKDMLTHLMKNDTIQLDKILHDPFYTPKSAMVADVLEHFKNTHINITLVIGEYGGLEGIVTLNDIVEQVLGDIDMRDKDPVQRADGSWLVDGQYSILELQEFFHDFDTPIDERKDYTTLAGFVLTRLGHIPQVAETFDWGSYHLEVMDMDGQRVDKVLISPKATK